MTDLVLLIPGVADGTPWYVELGIIAGALTSAAVIWKLGVVPGSRWFWHAASAVAAAILAAPQIVSGIEKLYALVEGDVLERIDAGNQRFNEQDARLGDHDLRLSRHESRLEAHDEAIAALHERVHQS